MVERAWVKARRALEPGVYGDKFATLAEAGWDGDWVSPVQMTSDDPTGPVLMGSHWLGLEKARKHRLAIERYGGYLPRIPFNRVLNLALHYAGLDRRDIYITQACHFVPRRGDVAPVPRKLWCEAYETVTQYEIGNRPVIALGKPARLICEEYGVEGATFFDHPSFARSQSHEARARDIAGALNAAKATAIPSAKER